MSSSWRISERPGYRSKRPAERVVEIPWVTSEDGSVQVFLLGHEADDRPAVPLVVFGPGKQAKVVQQHAAWMLQTITEATIRADSLYNLVEEPRLLDSTMDIADKLSIRVASDEVCIAQLKADGYAPYIAVGASGKHSAMFALVLRMVLAGDRVPREFWSEMTQYGIHEVINRISEDLQDVIARLLMAAREDERRPAIAAKPKATARGPPGKEAFKKEVIKSADLDGVSPIVPGNCSGDIELWIVRGCVPVINMTRQQTIFCEHISWLLQAAMSSEGKAKDLMQYVTNFDETPEKRSAYNECRSKCGLSDVDVGMVELAGLKGVLGVGTAGKRSCMLALVLAIALQDENNLADLEPQMQQMSPGLVEPFFSLVEAAILLQNGNGGSCGKDRNPADRSRAAGKQGDRRSEVKRERSRSRRWTLSEVKRGHSAR